MQKLPHQYSVTSTASARGAVKIEAEDKPALETAPPTAFGGPGDLWSPEDLLVAAVLDCFILTFRAMATASNLSWQSLSCSAEGTLDKVDGVTRFTQFQVNAELQVDSDDQSDKAERLLHKAEQACLITSSLKAPTELQARVVTAG